MTPTKKYFGHEQPVHDERIENVIFTIQHKNNQVEIPYWYAGATNEKMKTFTFQEASDYDITQKILLNPEKTIPTQKQELLQKQGFQTLHTYKIVQKQVFDQDVPSKSIFGGLEDNL